MDLDRILRPFSRRNKETNKASKPLTPEFRNRFFMRCVDEFPLHEPFGGIPPFWARMNKELKLLYGRIFLASDNGRPVVEDTIRFLEKCNDEQFLDFVEFTFRIQRPSPMASPNEVKLAEVNRFLMEDDLPYFVTDYVTTSRQSDEGEWTEVYTEQFPQVIRRDDEIVHETAIEPSLALLRHPAFCHANEEFLEALKEYRLEEYKDCVTKCASAYESVLKVICERKGWKLRGSGNATNLLTTVLNNTGLSQYYKNALQVVFIIRNEESTSHGAGSQPKNVPQHVAKYAISATASAIQLLVEDTGL